MVDNSNKQPARKSQGMRSRYQEQKAKPTLDEVVQQEENSLEESLAKAVREHSEQAEPQIEDTVFIKESALKAAGYNLAEVEDNSSNDMTKRFEAEEEAGLTRTINREELKRARKSAPQGKGKPVQKGKKKKQKEVLTPKQKLVRTIIGIVVFLIVAGICAIGFFTTYNIFHDMPYNAESQDFYEITVTENMTQDQIYTILVDNDLIANDSFLFKIRCKLFELKPVAGKYKISPAYNTEKIINIISGYDYSDGSMKE